jgi:hypothetical protein
MNHNIKSIILQVKKNESTKKRASVGWEIKKEPHSKRRILSPINGTALPNL